MTFMEKLEILIRRKGLSKTDFAKSVGVTYRSVANYIAGSRSPRKDVFRKMARKLGVSEKFLLNDNQSLILDSEERFIFYSTSDEQSMNEALILLSDAREIFGGSGLSDTDKQVLYSCVTEAYFAAKKDKPVVEAKPVKNTKKKSKV